MKMTEEQYLEECKRFLEYFDVPIDEEYIILTDGGNSCIMNPNSEWSELFGGHSINGVARYVAEKLGKKVKWIEY